MIHSELPTTSPASKSYEKKHTAIITPDKILLNEKLLLGLMFAGVSAVLITWAVRKKKVSNYSISREII